MTHRNRDDVAVSDQSKPMMSTGNTTTYNVVYEKMIKSLHLDFEGERFPEHVNHGRQRSDAVYWNPA